MWINVQIIHLLRKKHWFRRNVQLIVRGLASWILLHCMVFNIRLSENQKLTKFNAIFLNSCFSNDDIYPEQRYSNNALLSRFQLVLLEKQWRIISSIIFISNLTVRWSLTTSCVWYLESQLGTTLLITFRIVEQMYH